MTRPTTLLRTAGLALAGLVLLSGCWTSADDSAASSPSAQATQESTPSSPTSTVPSSACAAGDRAAETYECVGVTVEGAADEEPTIILADGFGPAQALQVADVYVGEGDPVDTGATLTVNYVGVGQQSGEIFDSSWQRGAPLDFPLASVIQGWQEGMLGMQPGGRRLLVIPGSLAYGSAGAPPSIGPDETLVFVVDLIAQVPAP